MAIGQGPDLGGDGPVGDRLFMPAYQRYAGNLYRQASLSRDDVEKETIRILIVSALYGLLDPRDTIRSYDVTMTSAVPEGGLVLAWWRRHGLRDLVLDVVRMSRPLRLHDLLPI